MQVTGDRTTPHGLATVAIDDEGVPATSFDLVRDGILVGYQLDRAIAASAGFGPSNGCAFADSPLHVPIQRMANVSLQPASAEGATTEELIAAVDRGLYVVGDKSWSIDMQRYNFQFTGSAVLRHRQGAPLRPGAETSPTRRRPPTSGEPWRPWAAGRPTGWAGRSTAGRDSRARWLRSPTAARRCSCGACGCSTPGRSRAGERRGLPPPQAVAEEALAAARSRADDCIVVVEEASEVDVRFANNTTTTNGDPSGPKRDGGGVPDGGRGDADGGGRPPRQRRPDRPGGRRRRRGHRFRTGRGRLPVARPGRRARGGRSGHAASTRRPATTISRSSPTCSTDSRGRSGGPGPPGTCWPGSPSTAVTTTYLGSSTGVRLGLRPARGRDPARGPRRRTARRSAWAGAGTDRLRRRLDRAARGPGRRADWGGRRRTVEWPAGRYEVVLPPEAVADLMVALAFAAGGRDAEDGTTVFSRPGGGTRVGDRLSALPFDLRSDPARARARVHAPSWPRRRRPPTPRCSTTGCRSSRTEWIDDGRLRRLRYHRAGAARLGATPAPFVDNLVLEVARGRSSRRGHWWPRTERGLLLTCLWYIREVDPATLLLTGLTRDGVYVVEDGKVVGATTTSASTRARSTCLARATEVGASGRALGREFGEYLSTGRACPPSGSPTST